MASKLKLTDRDNGWRNLKKRLGAIDEVEVVVGIMEKEGSAQRGSITHAELAAIHEYGTEDGSIPSRSFLRSTFDENMEKYTKALEDGSRETVKGSNPNAALRKVGEIARKDVIQKIRDRIPPKLEEATELAKGSDIPLIDTGQLVRSIKSDVRKTEPK